ncbi:MAG: CrcB family protein [bacterium]|nr:CrcB family protein [bacterium]MCP5071625.1 CrcB family protein [bacterium]
MHWLGVFLLGGCGAVARVWMATLVDGRFFPWATLGVNFLGCLAIGFLAELFEDRTALDPRLRVSLIGGFLGGFTTFSAFGLECWEFIARGALGMAAAYALGSLLLGVVGVGLGIGLARLVL